MDRDSQWAAGRKATKRLWGDKLAKAIEDSLCTMSPGFADFVMGSGFALYERPQLDYKTRSAMTVVMLAALGRSSELRLHIRGALKVGWTGEQIREMLMQVALYAGVPAAIGAFTVAEETFAKIEQKRGSSSEG